ncbi:protein of unknown function [Candidatus Nitrosocosmicus franklandus]|uniref:Uncharacterized protein n=1 Tax=Candidatus Nitrosocosmicus franklandianus TaxID=1798806 RepID=A0A484ID00_9ARCH|nr:protein of unknown function [Candidatus Nitrosocosmicus franklandus]
MNEIYYKKSPILVTIAILSIVLSTNIMKSPKISNSRQI